MDEKWDNFLFAFRPPPPRNEIIITESSIGLGNDDEMGEIVPKSRCIEN